MLRSSSNMDPHVPGLRARERAKTHWNSHLSTTSILEMIEGDTEEATLSQHHNTYSPGRLHQFYLTEDAPQLDRVVQETR